MPENNGISKISVSRETLRSELIALELRLVQEINALATVVISIPLQTGLLKDTIEDHEKRIRFLEKWEYALPISAIVTIVALIISIFSFLVKTSGIL